MAADDVANALDDGQVLDALGVDLHRGELVLGVGDVRSRVDDAQAAQVLALRLVGVSCVDDHAVEVEALAVVDARFLDRAVLVLRRR